MKIETQFAIPNNSTAIKNSRHLGKCSAWLSLSDERCVGISPLQVDIIHSFYWPVEVDMHIELIKSIKQLTKTNLMNLTF